MTARMLSSRPYLLRAMHEWMSDSGQTPQIVVDATLDGVSVPRQFIRDGRIVLNISHAATTKLDISNDRIECLARFDGQPIKIVVPVIAVLGIYSRESGQGMLFGGTEPDPPGHGGGEVGGEPGPGGRPKLKIVK